VVGQTSWFSHWEQKVGGQGCPPCSIGSAGNVANKLKIAGQDFVRTGVTWVVLSVEQKWTFDLDL